MNDEKNKKIFGLLTLTIGAIGIVYGDIGTSPLYAINELFFGRLSHLSGRLDIIGVISLVFWALTIVVALKYVFLILRADSEGEGGVFALYSLVSKLPNSNYIILSLLVFAAGLLYGDGIITPAISVISAVEGLTFITMSMQPFIVPITIIILLGLFSIQNFGTHKVGSVFGPIMLVWFFAIGFLGFNSLIRNPEILSAINPVYAIQFVFSHSFLTILLTLGSVMLVITGGEAMYADMGHFGRKPIRIGWYFLVYPMILLNYFGQGAYLLSGKTIIQRNIFYSIVPSYLIIPMICLSTAATIIASQALISGAFSLTMQAVSLRLLPYVTIKHTHENHGGQIYIGRVNWLLCFGSIFLILIFRSSSNLAGAYGLAVSGVMFVTSIGLMEVSQKLWKWKKFKSYLIFIPFLSIDFLFLSANSMKLFEGGFIPLLIGLIIFVIVNIWKWGRAHIVKKFESYQTMTLQELVQLQEKTKCDLPSTLIFLTRYKINSLEDKTPIQFQRFWERIQVLPRHLIFLNVEFLNTPHAVKKVSIQEFTEGNETNGSVTSLTVQFGFMEDPNIEKMVSHFIANNEIPSNDPPEKWIFKIVHERVLPNPKAKFIDKLKFRIFDLISRNTDNADDYFGLGREHQLVIDVFPVIMA